MLSFTVYLYYLVKCWSESVSYTHLDVYKRQPLLRLNIKTDATENGQAVKNLRAMCF